MKLTAISLVLLTLAAPAGAQVYVDGYWRSDGTYVQPHWRSTPDGNPFNNYSTDGNVNPYTGQHGDVTPYPVPQFPQYRYVPQTPQYPINPYAPQFAPPRPITPPPSLGCLSSYRC